MKFKFFSKTLALGSILLLSCAPGALAQEHASKQEQPPKKLDLGNMADTIGDVAVKVRSATILRPTLVVNGIYDATSMTVGAREIEFKPGARIVFNDTTPNTAGAFFVVAQTIKGAYPSASGAAKCCGWWAGL